MNVLTINLNDEYINEFNEYTEIGTAVSSVNGIQEMIHNIMKDSYDFCVYTSEDNEIYWKTVYECIKGIRPFAKHVLLVEEGDVSTMLDANLMDIEVVLEISKGVKVHLSEMKKYGRVSDLGGKYDPDYKSDESIQISKGLTLDMRNLMALTYEGNIKLTDIEISILEVLVDFKGAPVSREDILNNIDPFRSEGNHRKIDSHVKNIREKLGFRVIQSVRGIGYRINMNTGRLK